MPMYMYAFKAYMYMGINFADLNQLIGFIMFISKQGENETRAA